MTQNGTASIYGEDYTDASLLDSNSDKSRSSSRLVEEDLNL